MSATTLPYYVQNAIEKVQKHPLIQDVGLLRRKLKIYKAHKESFDANRGEWAKKVTGLVSSILQQITSYTYMQQQGSVIDHSFQACFELPYKRLAEGRCSDKMWFRYLHKILEEIHSISV